MVQPDRARVQKKDKMGENGLMFVTSVILLFLLVAVERTLVRGLRERKHH